MAVELSKKEVNTVSIDQYIHPDTKKYSLKTIEADVDEYDFNSDASEVEYLCWT